MKNLFEKHIKAHVPLKIYELDPNSDKAMGKLGRCAGPRALGGPARLLISSCLIVM